MASCEVTLKEVAHVDTYTSATRVALLAAALVSGTAQPVKVMPPSALAVGGVQVVARVKTAAFAEARATRRTTVEAVP